MMDHLALSQPDDASCSVIQNVDDKKIHTIKSRKLLILFLKISLITHPSKLMLSILYFVIPCLEILGTQDKMCIE